MAITAHQMLHWSFVFFLKAIIYGFREMKKKWDGASEKWHKFVESPRFEVYFYFLKSYKECSAHVID